MKRIIIMLIMLSGLLLSSDEVNPITKEKLGINYVLNPNGLYDVFINLNSKELNSISVKELEHIISKYSNNINLGVINLEIGNVDFSNIVYIPQSKGFLNSLLENAKNQNEKAELLYDLILYSLQLIILGALGMTLVLKISQDISEKMKNEGFPKSHYLIKYGLRFILICFLIYFSITFIDIVSKYINK